MSRQNVGGLEMFYELEGAGAPVVFIGGLSQDHMGWMFQAPAVVAAGYQSLRFDSRDAGQTAQSPGGYDLAQFAADTVGLMDALHIQSAHIVGMSMGGMIAQEIALAHPSRVSSLTLVCTTAAVEAPTSGVLQAWKASRPHCEEVDFVLSLSPWLFTHRFYQIPQAVQGFLDVVKGNPFPQSVEGFQRQCDAVLAHHTRDRLSRITAPTHVIVGSEDILTPARYSQELAEAIPGARLTIIPEAAHVLTMENPEAFNRAMLEFLQAQPKPASV
jgi:3-oxoadipate enol-lactonase